MAPVAEFAKLNLRNVPEFAALTLPPSNATAQRAVAAAYAMADAATEHAQTLIDSGLPATFADDLRTAAAAVNDSLAGRSKHLGRRAGATAGIGDEEKRGRALLKVLNALIMARIGNSAQLIAEWTMAKAMRRKPGPAAGSVASDVTPIQPWVITVTPQATPASTATPVPPPMAEAA
ncbi:MAG: hypothetical protein ABI442_12845 [Gemmatimonadaceae bacterium]